MMVFLTVWEESPIHSCSTTTGEAEIESKQGQLGLHWSETLSFPLQRWKGACGSLFCTVWMWLFLRQRRDMETGQVPHFFPGHMQDNGSEPGTVQGEAKMPRK